jgi:hypothetical protein
MEKHFILPAVIGLNQRTKVILSEFCGTKPPNLDLIRRLSLSNKDDIQILKDYLRD